MATMDQDNPEWDRLMAEHRAAEAEVANASPKDVVVAQERFEKASEALAEYRLRYRGEAPLNKG